MRKLIVIEGLDGSGKATQTQQICGALRESGITARMVSFPDYKSASSSLVKMYLSGEFGSQTDNVNAYAASSFLLLIDMRPFSATGEMIMKIV